MEDEEYLELIKLTKAQMVEYGLGDLADDHNYLEDVDETDGTEARLPPPKDHLLLLLDAFLLRIKLLDVATVKRSLDAANRLSGEEGPNGASLDFPMSASGEVRRFNLLGLPDMSNLRADLTRLIGALRETPAPRPKF